MSYLKIIILIFSFSTISSYATDFEVTFSNKTDDVIYYSLLVKNNNGVKAIDVDLEGNSHDATIRQTYTFSCPCGKVDGVRLNMDSPTVDGPLSFDNLYFLDDDLNIVFAKSYSRISGKWVDPVSLKNSVCNRSSGGVKNSPLTKKDYIVDSEFIQQGPFSLKGTDNISIKYIDDNPLKFIREDVNGERVIDSIGYHDNMSSLVSSVFFMNIHSEMNIISLVYWGGGVIGEGDYYKVYGYKYDKKGNIHANAILSKDPNLSGYNTKEKPFKYKNASSIKKYIINNYGS